MKRQNILNETVASIPQISSSPNFFINGPRSAASNLCP